MKKHSYKEVDCPISTYNQASGNLRVSKPKANKIDIQLQVGDQYLTLEIEGDGDFVHTKVLDCSPEFMNISLRF